MPTASIRVNALVPPQAVPINVVVALSNNGSGGEFSFAWTLLDQPEGAADALVGAATPTPTITPKKEGTYLLLLVVNADDPTEQRTTAIFYVKRFVDGRRPPAAGETTEASLQRGWAEEVNRELNDLADLRKDSGRLAGVIAVAGTTANSTVLYASATQQIKATLPGAEFLPTFDVATASARAKVAGSLYVLDRGVVSGSAPGIGEVVWARRDGVAYGVPLAGTAFGQPIYVSDVGTLALSPGTYPRMVGRVAKAYANSCDVLVSGEPQFGQAGTLLRFGSAEASVGTPWPLSFGFQQVVPTVFLLWPPSTPGRWSRLAVYLQPNVGGRSFDVRAYKNGNPTSLVARVTNAAPFNFDLDQTHAVEFVLSDTMELRVENVIAVAAPTDINGISATVFEQVFG